MEPPAEHFSSPIHVTSSIFCLCTLPRTCSATPGLFVAVAQQAQDGAAEQLLSAAQLLAQPRKLETRKPFPHVLRLGEGPSPKARGAGPSTESRLIYKRAHIGVTFSLQCVMAVGQGGEAEELSSAPPGLGHPLPITSLLAARFFTVPQLCSLSL